MGNRSALPYTDAEDAATSFLTLWRAQASTTLKAPSYMTSSASRGFSAQRVMRSAAMWKT